MISITLPSIYPQCLARAVANIEATTRSPYEIIVISPFHVIPYKCGGGSGLTVVGAVPHELVWMQDKLQQGANAAHALGLHCARGEFILPWVDDHSLIPGWDELVLKDFEEREHYHRGTTSSLHKSPLFALGLRHADRVQVGTAFGCYYPYFPLMRRESINRVGWLTGDYKVGFADIDLAMRIWATGGRCEWSREGVVTVCSDDDRKLKGPMLENEGHSLPADMHLFLARWRCRFGVGWDATHLRGFNVDIRDEKTIVSGRTIYNQVVLQ